MKKLLLLSLVFLSFNLSAQFTVNPNNVNRGQTLTTTVTPPGGVMTTSSGMASMYQFYLTQGNLRINATSYTLDIHYPLGFADHAYVIFNIPQNALPGFYNLHIDNYFPWVIQNAIRVDETMLKGNVFFDANQNGIRETTEFGMTSQSVRIEPGGRTLLTDYKGDYCGFLNTGTFKDSLVVPQNYSLTTPFSSYSITVPPDDTIGNDFGLYTPPNSILIHDFISGIDRIRCQRLSNSFWQISSQSNNFQNGTITMVKDSNLTFISSTIVPSYISSDTIKWNYSLQPFQTLRNLVAFQGGPPGTNANLICYDSLFNVNGNFDTTFVQVLTDKVRCSYDPNEKSVSPEGFDSFNHYTRKTGEFTYTIRFQNCGNDTAFDIFILDTLSATFKLNTLRILYSSHTLNTQIEAGGVIRFNFNNIMLPDSNIDEMNSHGLVIYSIAPNINAPEFTVVRNRAHIYFDSNPAVRTNQTFNTLVSQIPDGILITSERNISFVYPNPVTENSVLILPDDKEYLFRVFDLTGKEIISVTVSQDYILHSEDLPDGIFYYQLINSQNGIIATNRFVVVH